MRGTLLTGEDGTFGSWLPDPGPALRAMLADPWGGNVQQAIAYREQGGMQVAAFSVAADGAVAEHRHTFHELLVPLALAEGQQIGWQVDGGRRCVVPLRSGSVLLAVAGQRHAADWRAGWLRLGVKVDPAWLAAFVTSTFGWRRVELVASTEPANAPELANAAHDLLRLETDAGGDVSAMVTFVRHLLGTFGVGPGLARARALALEGHALRTALELLAGPPIANAAIARRLGLSDWQFSRSFGAAMGMPPARWALRQRARAKDLLERSSDLLLPDVASRAGFTSVRQMQRSFQSLFACSAAQTRMRMAKRRLGLSRALPSPD